MTSQQIVSDLMSEACVSLFNDYSLPLQAAPDTDTHVDRALLYCSVIGFSSQQMRGTLVLATTSEPLGRTAPVNGSSLREWVAELSNQLLGRVKRQLMDRGVDLAMSTPIVLRGEHLHPMPNKDAAPLTFTCDGGCVCVWMDAEISADVDLTQVQVGGASMAEGEAMLF